MPKISELTATTTLNATDEFAINQAGTTKKITRANMLASNLATELAFATGGTGRYYIFHDVATSGGQTLAASTLYFKLLKIYRAITVDQIAYNVSSLAAGSLCNAGIYTANTSTGRPDTLLAEAASQGDNSTASSKPLAFASGVVINPGLYWGCIGFNATGCGVTGTGTGLIELATIGATSISTGGGAAAALSASWTPAANLPSTAPAASVSAVAPFIWLRRSA